MSELLESTWDQYLDLTQAERYIRTSNHLDFINLDDQFIKNNAFHFLRLCGYYGCCDIAEYIISRITDISIPYNYLMRRSVAANRIDMVKLFLRHGANIQNTDNHALKIACCNGYYDMAVALIDMGANVKACNSHSLQVAASNGNNKLVELLLVHGANIHAGIEQALTWAYQNKHTSTVELLIKHGAEPKILELIPKNNMYVLKVVVTECSFYMVRTSIDDNGKVLGTHEIHYEQ